MDKAILEQLSVGFEIEGAFRSGMWERLGFKGQFVHDGSVRVREYPFEAERIPLNRPRSCRQCTYNEDGELHRYCLAHHARYRSEGSIAQEYSSAVYEDFQQCMKALKLFNARNHVWDYSCGLHFHVGAKNKKYKQLWGIVSNYKYLKQLVEEAKGYCEHQAERLRTESALNFCRPYNTKRELIQCTDTERFHPDRQKYRFVRFHPEHKTLEFRFLVPCEHKVTNVQKLLNSLTSYLGRDENVNAYGIAETAAHEPETINIEKTLKKTDNEKLDIIRKLYSGNDEYRNSNHYYRAREFQKLVERYGEEEANRMLHQQNEPVQTYQDSDGYIAVEGWGAGGSGVRLIDPQHRDAVVREVSRHLNTVPVSLIDQAYMQIARQTTPTVEAVYTMVQHMRNMEGRWYTTTSPVRGFTTSAGAPMGTVLTEDVILSAMESLRPVPYDVDEEDED